MDAELPGRAGKRRRRANEAGGRDIRREVTVTAEEDAKLIELAAAQGVTVPRLLFEAALSPNPGETATQRRDLGVLLFDLRRILAMAGSNINQIARKANVNDEFPGEARAALRQMRGLMERIDQAIDGLGDPR